MQFMFNQCSPAVPSLYVPSRWNNRYVDATAPQSTVTAAGNVMTTSIHSD